MEPVRLARQEEIEMLKSLGKIDFDYTSSVVAFGEGEQAVYSLIKAPMEIYTYPMDVISDKRKFMFMWAIENAMRLNGAPSYYFQVESSPELSTWRKALESFGAHTTAEPQFRFKKKL